MLRRSFAFAIAVLGRSLAVTAHAVGRGRDPLSLRQLALQGGAGEWGSAARPSEWGSNRGRASGEKTAIAMRQAQGGALGVMLRGIRIRGGHRLPACVHSPSC